MTDLWVEATHDVDAEQRAYGLEMAKSAGQGAWGFLALARTKQEFADRVALASDSIVRAAGAGGVRAEDLLKVFTERFALLMEAGENPFADKDDTGEGDDEDDSDKHGDGKSDAHGDDDADQDDTDDSDSDVDDAGTDETDDNGTDGGDDKDQDDDGKDNADDDGSGKDKDPDQKDDMDGREASPAFGGIYSSLLARINAGEDPLAWGGRPFVASLGRAVAVGADEPPVSDTNTPTPTADASGDGGAALPGLTGTDPLTTKPRQAPGGDQSLSTPPADPGLDPAMNGGDIQAQQPQDDNPFTSKLRAIAYEVHTANPDLSVQRCLEVAHTVMGRFRVQAEDVSPLLFGDRGKTPDGPLTRSVKSWEPPSPKGPGKGSQDPSEGGQDGEGGDGGTGGAPDAAAGAEGAEGAAGAGEAAGAAGAAGEVAELAPLLLL